MSTHETFQIPLEVAEAYEARFVPAIFAEWAPRLLDAVGAQPGDRLLDVACGTGIVARHAAARTGPTGRVVGVDLNEAMLTVARRLRPELDWQQGDVAALPFDDGSFDVVTCQMAMMFFPDRRRAFSEMARVLRPGGAVGVVVPAGLDVQPAYRPFVDAAVDHTGPEARSLLGTYWNCGDLDALLSDAESAGLTPTDRSTIAGVARFESCDDFVMTEIGSSPLADRIDERQAAALRDAVGDRLARYAGGDAFEVPLLCHVVAVRA